MVRFSQICQFIFTEFLCRFLERNFPSVHLQNLNKFVKRENVEKILTKTVNEKKKEFTVVPAISNPHSVDTRDMTREVAPEGVGTHRGNFVLIVE